MCIACTSQTPVNNINIAWSKLIDAQVGINNNWTFGKRFHLRSQKGVEGEEVKIYWNLLCLATVISRCKQFFISSATLFSLLQVNKQTTNRKLVYNAYIQGD